MYVFPWEIRYLHVFIHYKFCICVYYIMYSEMGACICIFCIVARDLNVKVIVLIQGHGFMKH